VAIGNALSLNDNDALEIKIDGLCISPGWYDYGVLGGNLGQELYERKSSLISAATAGGYTQISVWPEGNPFADNLAVCQSIRHTDQETGLVITPIGGLSKQGEGKELAELYNMLDAGVVAFSDGHRSQLVDPLIKKSLEYLKNKSVKTLVVPTHKDYSYGHNIHEGVVSTRMGLKGDPAIGERLKIQALLEMRDYTDGQLIIHLLSTEDGVKLLQEDEQITASVSALHLCHTVDDLSAYQSLFKLDPVLRLSSDRDALRNAVGQKTISSIVSDHTPRNKENWQREYTQAMYGQSTIELCYSILQSHADDVISTERIVSILSYGNKEAIGIKTSTIQEGATVDFTLFNPSEECTPKTLQSDGKNSAYLNKTLTGRVKATLINETINLIH